VSKILGKITIYLPKLIAFFNSNTKVLIFAIHPHKVSIFFNSTNIPKYPYCPFFIFLNKKTNLGVQKWLDGPRATPNFFYKKLKIKKLGAIWEVLDTIDQIEKIWNFGGVNCKN
jgi:hypothetical protein